MRILLVTPPIGWPLAYGGEIRRWNVLQGLLQAGDVDALIFRPPTHMVPAQAFVGCHRVMEVTDGGTTEREKALYQSTVGRGQLTLGTKWPYEYLACARDSWRAELPADFSWDHYDLVWIARLRPALYLGRLTTVPAILDGDDFDYVREWLLLRSAPWYGAKIWNYIDVAKLWMIERRLARDYAWVVRCSREDVRRHPAENVVVIPNGAYVPDAIERQPAHRVLFVGALGYGPNRQGLEWFVDHVWPEVRRAVPDAALDIAGKDPSPRLLEADGTDGIAVHGFVEDLTDLYRSAAMTVVPLHAGGGTRLKILESLARGVPVVSTPIGAFGIDGAHESGLNRVDTAEDFARACIAGLRDPEGGVLRATRGRDLVLDRYDWRGIQRQVADLVRRTVTNRSPAC